MPNEISSNAIVDFEEFERFISIMIGKNCHLSHQTTLRVVKRVSRIGYLVIGDNVYIGPGAKVIGDVHVGK